MTNCVSTLPVANLEDFLSVDPRQQRRFVDTVGDALVENGFFALSNHGVNHALIRKAYQTCEQFFLLPEEIKARYEKAEWKYQRGFAAFGREHAKDSAFPDLKEFWHVGRENFHNDGKMYFPNIWPTEIDGFREELLAIYQQAETCSIQVLTACARYLGEPDATFAGMVPDGDSVLRVIHYPPIPADTPAGWVRAAAHEDINLITFLCEATGAGLELKGHDGRWRPIHALAGHIIVDSGDMLQNLTNGLFKSTTHRVVNPPDHNSRRFSMPFFCHPRADCSLAPLRSCVERTGGKAQYADLSASRFLSMRLEEIGLS